MVIMLRYIHSHHSEWTSAVGDACTHSLGISPLETVLDQEDVVDGERGSITDLEPHESTM